MRSLKIYTAGELNDTLYQIISDNIRYPDASLGDLRAQIAACQVGAQRYAELSNAMARDVVEDCIGTVWDQAEPSVRRVIEQIPDGVYRPRAFSTTMVAISVCPYVSR